ncbi:Ribosomal-protein-serine acetyltransferase [Burkholderia sp. AD24]|nr:Ribosomal-protein-serine acetyltransferase [Burkholderia sp. AD24]
MDQLDEKLIKTARLILLPLKANHAVEMFRGLSDVSSYEFTPDIPCQDVAALEKRYRRLESRRSPNGQEAWLNWVISSAATREFLGYVQFTVKPLEQRALVAYFVFVAHRQQGIASEAIRASMAEVAEGFRLSRVDAEIDTRNAASIALIEKLGFFRTRLVPHADEFKGAVSDEYHYSYTLPVDNHHLKQGL